MFLHSVKLQSVNVSTYAGQSVDDEWNTGETIASLVGESVKFDSDTERERTVEG